MAIAAGHPVQLHCSRTAHRIVHEPAQLNYRISSLIIGFRLADRVESAFGGCLTILTDHTASATAVCCDTRRQPNAISHSIRFAVRAPHSVPLFAELGKFAGSPIMIGY